MCTSSTRKGGGRVGKGRPVKIITDNSVETTFSGKMRLIMTLSMPFKSKLSPHRHRGGMGYEHACPLTLGTGICQSMKHQDNFFVIL